MSTEFEKWWDDERAQNSGVTIGADYRHWALHGWQAARATPSLDVDALMALACTFAEVYGRLYFARQCGVSITRIGEKTEAAREALRSALMSNAAPEVDGAAECVEAARYRYIRANGEPTSGLGISYSPDWSPEKYDAAIDAAIRALTDPLQGKETP